MIEPLKLIQMLFDEGVPRKVIARVVEALSTEEVAFNETEDSLEARRRRNRERMRTVRAQSAQCADTVCAQEMHNVFKTEIPPTPPKEKTILLSESPLKEVKQVEEVLADGRRPDLSTKFDDFWAAYPKRDGSNPKTPASKKFLAAVKSGVTPEKIMQLNRFRSLKTMRQQNWSHLLLHHQGHLENLMK